MLRRFMPFVSGLLLGLLATAALKLLLSKPYGYPVEIHPPPTPAPYHVHVAGAVNAPGVYTFSPGSIVQEAIDTAGGSSEGAVLDMLNLAAELVDGQQVYVPCEGQPTPVTFSSDPANDGATLELINVNTATAPELERLPGIGPSLAKKIIECREANGPFLDADDLLEVSGIGPSKLEEIRALITFR